MTKVKTRVKTRTIVILVLLGGAAAVALVATQLGPGAGTGPGAPGATITPSPCTIIAKEQSPLVKDSSPGDSSPLAFLTPQPAEAAHLAGNNPNVSDGFLQLDIERPDGSPASAEIELKRAGQVVEHFRVLGGQGQANIDAGTYTVKATSINNGWSGTKTGVIVIAGTSRRYRIELDTPPPTTAEIVLPPAPTTMTAVSVFDGTHPQVAGQVCDPQNQPINRSGTLAVLDESGLPRGQLNINAKRQGKFELFNLGRGKYYLLFSSGNYAGEKTIEVPLKVVLPIKQWLSPGTLPSPLSP